MVSDEKALAALGRRIGATLGDGPDEAQRQAQRAAVLRRLQQGPARVRPRITALVAAAAGVALVVGAAGLASWWWRAGQPPQALAPGLSFQVEGAAQPGRVGRWLEARGGALALRFEGGTRFELASGARAQVLESSRRQVSLRLDHGVLRADVKRGQTLWEVVAGPYRVTVVGTAFTTRWDASRGGLQVRVRRGRVRVTGDGLTPAGVELGAEEELRVDRAAQRWSVTRGEVVSAAGGPAVVRPVRPVPRPATVARPEGPGGADAAGTTMTPGTTGPAPRLTPATVGAKGTALPPWKQHLAAGRFRAAVLAAEAAGLPALVRVLPAADLWALARAGRLSRRGATARQALEALRRRFPGSANARTAAFLLGRVSVELLGDPAGAARWFERYLAESPAGPLAEEALGRAVDAHGRAGHRAAARRLAARYLQRHPAGTFAPLARRALLP